MTVPHHSCWAHWVSSVCGDTCSVPAITRRICRMRHMLTTKEALDATSHGAINAQLSCARPKRGPPRRW